MEEKPVFPATDVVLSEAEVRKKILDGGAASCTDAELLGLIIAYRTRPRTSLQKKADDANPPMMLASELLSQFKNSLTDIGMLSISNLRMFKDMGQDRAIVIAAALELGKRRKVEDSVNMQEIRSKEDAVTLFKPLLAELPYEEFWAVYLASSNRIIDKIRIGQGNANATIVDVRRVIGRAIDKFATSILLVHNHPSGNIRPSRNDIELTDKIKQAAALFDLRLMDHIIVTYGESFSFKGEGLL